MAIGNDQVHVMWRELSVQDILAKGDMGPVW